MTQKLTQRTLRNRYMNGSVDAALKERSSGKLGNAPYPPPKRIVRPPRSDVDPAWLADTRRLTPSVLNQFHPDYDWRAALRYHAVSGGYLGRGFVEYLTKQTKRGMGLFGEVGSETFKRAVGRLRVLAKWCRSVSMPAYFQALSLAKAEDFMRDRFKRGLALSTLGKCRATYAKLWAHWLSGELAFVTKSFGECEPIENPWEQPESDPVAATKGIKKRKLRVNPKLGAASGRKADSLAQGRMRRPVRVDEYAATVELKVNAIKAAGITSRTAIAAELNTGGFPGPRGGAWTATSIRNIEQRTAGWGPLLVVSRGA